MKEDEQTFAFEAPAKVGDSRTRNAKSETARSRTPMVWVEIECHDPRFTMKETQLAVALAGSAKTGTSHRNNAKSGTASPRKPLILAEVGSRDPRLTMKENQQALAPEAPAKTGKSQKNNIKSGTPSPPKPVVLTEIEGRDRRFMRRPEVERITGWSRSTLYRQIAAGTFPAPIKLSSNTVGFLAAQVFAWMDSRLACHEDDEIVGERI